MFKSLTVEQTGLSNTYLIALADICGVVSVALSCPTGDITAVFTEADTGNGAATDINLIGASGVQANVPVKFVEFETVTPSSSTVATKKAKYHFEGLKAARYLKMVVTNSVNEAATIDITRH